jgi:hypothetical protein
MQTQTMSTPTADGSHLVTVTMTPNPNAAPPVTNNWQIHRTDADTVLLNTATGETWFLDKRGERQYEWQRIARDGAPPPPAYHPPVLGEPSAVPPSQEFQTR